MKPRNLLVVLFTIIYTSCKVLPIVNRSYHDHKLTKLLEYDYLEITSKVYYQNLDKENGNVKLKIRLHKDNLIWISVSTFLGFEILRLSFTINEVTILNRVQKTYQLCNYELFSEIMGFSVNYQLIQSIILGILPNCTESSNFASEQVLDSFTINYFNWLLLYIINLEGNVEYDILDTKSQKYLTVIYKNINDNENQVITMQLYSTKNKDIPMFNVSLSRIKSICHNRPLQFSFIVPKGYEKK